MYPKSDVPWFWIGSPIAQIDVNTIVLYETQYFEDLRALVAAYEQATGYEITLKYWQSPKDTPLPK